MKANILVLLISVSCLSSCFGARILVMFPVVSKSHKFGVTPVVEALAAKGHEITFITPYPPSQKMENVHEIVLHDTGKFILEHEINWFTMEKEGATQIFSFISYIRAFIRTAYDDLMKNEEFLSILQQRSVDLLIVDAFFNEFAYVMNQHVLKVPVVMHTSGSGVSVNLAAMGAPMDYGSIPTILSEFDDQMNFFQRLANMVQAELFELTYNLAVYGMIDDMVAKDFPDSRPVADLTRTVDLFLFNGHPTTTYPRSLPPSVIPVGALHTRPAKPLPQHLSKFADEAKEGFIVFTLGSLVPVSSMPEENLQTFLNVFAKLPQKVIWKWEAASIPQGVSTNVMMADWLPQQDLLGHPNVRLFITHGGLLGMQEATYHAVPLLGIPCGNDQKANIAKARKEGYGLGLEWGTLNEENLLAAIHRLINEQSFKANATRVSGLMRDQIVPGKDVAVYWIEHVLRHGGAQHLQLNSKTMPFYQRHLLDVFAFLLIVSLISLFVTLLLLRCILSKCFRPKKMKSN